MTIADFDQLDVETKRNLLTQCCGSSVWVNKMMDSPPVEDLVDLEELAEKAWWSCSESDWLEAFSHHPQIGDIDSLKKKFASTAAWASGEQAGVSTADHETLIKLQAGNKAYERKFGFIFIVCATGKSAEEMLEILEARLPNNYAEEINIAAEEQRKITSIRLEKLFNIQKKNKDI